ncbi:MAG: VCBS repeat-containing protein, partial [Myxococcales bacterium]|nr:VCBS repeat-containing protein [Myxococcales bacterium]
RGRFRDASERLDDDNQQDIRAATLDVDGDDDLDIAVFGSGPARLLINDGNGYFTDRAGQWLPSRFVDCTPRFEADCGGDQGGTIYDAHCCRAARPVVLDMDGDGSDDLALVSQRQEIALLVNNLLGEKDALPTRFVGDYELGLDPLLTTNTRGHEVTVADVNSDSRPDLAILTNGAAGTVHIFQNLLESPIEDGSGPWFYEVAGAIPAFGEQYDLAGSLCAGDFDGDGADDLVIATQAGELVAAPEGEYQYSADGKVFLFLSRSDQFGVAFLDATEALPEDLAGTLTLSCDVGDFNLDGALDLLLSGYHSGNVLTTAPAPALPAVNNDRELTRLFLNDGLVAEDGGGFSGSFRRDVLPATPDKNYAVAGADIDGDGLLEIIAAGVGQLELWDDAVSRNSGPK